jgi:phage internal scaffolding protein
MFRSAYSAKERLHPPQGGPSLTKQSFAQESNINFIIAKYRQTGLLEHVAEHKGQYGEHQNIDYHEALNAIRKAEAMFDSIPADIRKRFDNDPGKFVDHVMDPKNQESVYEMGLAERPFVLEANPGVPAPAEPSPLTTGD